MNFRQHNLVCRAQDDQAGRIQVDGGELAVQWWDGLNGPFESQRTVQKYHERKISDQRYADR